MDTRVDPVIAPGRQPARFSPVQTAGLLIGFVALLLVGLVGLQRTPVPLPLVSPPPGPPALGIDTSSYQHPHGARIDWLAVRGAGVSYVYLKATEGSDLVDPWFTRDWSGVAAAGLYRGAYHYARPEAGSAMADADAFLEVAGKLGATGDLPPALDVEEAGALDPAALADWVGDWAGEVEQRTGRTPVVYTRASFWTLRMAGTDRFAASPLWVARYTTEPDPGPPFGGWPTWTLWQWSSTGTTAGVPIPVDQDRLAGGGPALAALAAQRTEGP
jgi:GH25 family lysozyme M1 (1,4-beta-N-acetylmuramidase)